MGDEHAHLCYAWRILPGQQVGIQNIDSVVAVYIHGIRIRQGEGVCGLRNSQGSLARLGNEDMKGPHDDAQEQTRAGKQQAPTPLIFSQ
jgi:hypothetical protein